jgi:hypothetical protein
LSTDAYARWYGRIVDAMMYAAIARMVGDEMMASGGAQMTGLPVVPKSDIAFVKAHRTVLVQDGFVEPTLSVQTPAAH